MQPLNNLGYDELISVRYSFEAGIYTKLSTGLPAEQKCIGVQQDVNSRAHSSPMVFKCCLERASNLEKSAIGPMERPVGLLQSTRTLLRKQYPVVFNRYASNVRAAVRLHKEGTVPVTLMSANRVANRNLCPWRQ